MKACGRPGSVMVQQMNVKSAVQVKGLTHFAY